MPRKKATDKPVETEAARLVKYAEVVGRTMTAVIQAAEIAVVEVEESIKKYGDLSDHALKEAAVDIALKLLDSWGVSVSGPLADEVVAVVEWAYQQMKQIKRADEAFRV